jgi:hypothetical protein
MRIEEDYAKKRKPLTDRIDEIRTHLRNYMDEHKITCLAVDVIDVDLESKNSIPVRRFLKRKQSSTIGTLNLEGIERAIQKITPDDLRDEYKNLKEKQEKERIKQQRKRKSTVDEKEEIIEEKTLAMLDVWNSVIVKKVREEHLRKTDSLELDVATERTAKRVSTETMLAPREICVLVQEWMDKRKTVSQNLHDKKTATAEPQQTVKQQESVVAEYLERTHPVDKCQEVILNYKQESRPYMLRQKQSRSTIPVRIKAFKPYINTSVEQVMRVHASEMDNFISACSSTIKAELVEILRHQYSKHQQDHQPSSTYVALDKVHTRVSKDN